MKTKQHHCKKCGYLKLAKPKQTIVEDVMSTEGNQVDDAIADKNFQENLNKNFHYGNYCRCKK